MKTHYYNALLDWSKPVYFVWGCCDEIFTEAWGGEWASRMNSSFDAIPEASLFLQNTHCEELAKLVLDRISDE